MRLEIRRLCNKPDNTRCALLERGATYLGDYAFTDHIYSASNYSNLNDEFVRIRHYQKTNWQQKDVVIVHKIRDNLEGNHQTLLKEECDSFEEAIAFIPKNFTKKFSFSRHGWEFHFESMHIFIEEIDGLVPSIELVAPSRQEILSLFNELQVTNILTDSVPEWFHTVQKNRMDVLESSRTSLNPEITY